MISITIFTTLRFFYTAFMKPKRSVISKRTLVDLYSNTCITERTENVYVHPAYVEYSKKQMHFNFLCLSKGIQTKKKVNPFIVAVPHFSGKSSCSFLIPLLLQECLEVQLTAVWI